MATASAYKLTGKRLNPQWSGQKALVVQAFTSIPKESLTVSEIAKFLDLHPKFSTVQSSERIAAYYVCILNKEGYIARAENVDDNAPSLEELYRMRDFYASKLDSIVELIESLTVETVETVEN
jgi:hypothetical protein